MTYNNMMRVWRNVFRRNVNFNIAYDQAVLWGQKLGLTPGQIEDAMDESLSRQIMWVNSKQAWRIGVLCGKQDMSVDIGGKQYWMAILFVKQPSIEGHSWLKIRANC